jgi:hypothetical protein
VRLRLTAAGRRVLADGQANTADVEGFIAGRLTKDDMARLAALLHKLLHDTPGGRAIKTRHQQPGPQQDPK